MYLLSCWELSTNIYFSTQLNKNPQIDSLWQWKTLKRWNGFDPLTYRFECSFNSAVKSLINQIKYTQQQKSWNIESILISVQKHSSSKLVESSSVNKCCWILIWIIIIAQNLSADFQWVSKLYFSLRKWENYFKIISKLFLLAGVSLVSR